MGLTFAADTASVRVPATSANLGPGFDALGLALTRYDDVTARVTDSGYTVAGTGEGAGEPPTDERHLVAPARPSHAGDVRRARPPPARVRRGVREPHPAGPRTGFLVGRHRGRGATG